MTKRAIQAAAINSLDEQLDLERDLQREAGRSADYAEGVSAFLEKRKPEFRANERHQPFASGARRCLRQGHVG